MKRTSTEAHVYMRRHQCAKVEHFDVSNVIYYKFSHGAVFYTLNGENVNVMLEYGINLIYHDGNAPLKTEIVCRAVVSSNFRTFYFLFYSISGALINHWLFYCLDLDFISVLRKMVNSIDGLETCDTCI